MRALYKSIWIIRPINLIIIVLTMVSVHLFFFEQSVVDVLCDQVLWRKITVMVLLAAAGNIMNDYFDVKEDLINRPQRVSLTDSMSRKWALLVYVLLSAYMMLLSYQLSVMRSDFFFIIIPLFIWLGLLFYSPILKRFPFVANIWVAFCTAMVPVWTIWEFQNNNELFARLGGIYFFSALAFCTNLIREMIKDIEDQKGDLVVGKQTTIIVFGSSITKRVIYFLIVGVLVLEGIYGWMFLQPDFTCILFALLILIPAIIILPLFSLYSVIERPQFFSSYFKVMMVLALLFLFFSTMI
jgi:4-hydroxybenzoate polyprenyltransferase